jgi:hypothetical protein
MQNKSFRVNVLHLKCIVPSRFPKEKNVQHDLSRITTIPNKLPVQKNLLNEAVSQILARKKQCRHKVAYTQQRSNKRNVVRGHFRTYHSSTIAPRTIKKTLYLHKHSSLVQDYDELWRWMVFSYGINYRDKSTMYQTTNLAMCCMVDLHLLLHKSYLKLCRMTNTNHCQLEDFFFRAVGIMISEEFIQRSALCLPKSPYI